MCLYFPIRSFSVFWRGRGRGARSPAKANDNRRASEAGFAVK